MQGTITATRPQALQGKKKEHCLRVLFDSRDEQIIAQNLLNNIGHRTGNDNGVNIIAALTMYNESLKVKK